VYTTNFQLWDIGHLITHEVQKIHLHCRYFPIIHFLQKFPCKVTGWQDFWF